jgi:hypothetical protein
MYHREADSATMATCAAGSQLSCGCMRSPTLINAGATIRLAAPITMRYWLGGGAASNLAPPVVHSFITHPALFGQECPSSIDPPALAA